ncbi:MJ0042-type zinc finger domain-containing protein [Actinomycetes bacterium NPDC127524]
MAETSILEIECPICKAWFPSLDSTCVIEGKVIECPKCNELINSNYNIRRLYTPN